MHDLPDRRKWLTPTETPRQERENALGAYTHRLRDECNNLREHFDALRSAVRRHDFCYIEREWPAVLQEIIKCKNLDRDVQDLNRALNSELEQQ